LKKTGFDSLAEMLPRLTELRHLTLNLSTNYLEDAHAQTLS